MAETADGWMPIATAPKDGTAIELLFPGGRRIQTRTGPGRSQVPMPERIVVGKWWSADDAFRKVGSRSTEGARGALIQKNGGYWGKGRKRSKPLAGNPTHWRPLPALPNREPGARTEERT